MEDLTDELFDAECSGVFRLSGPVLIFPSNAERVGLHELAHAVSLVGSRYYAKYCAAKIQGTEFRLNVPVLEALPRAFIEFGGRHSEGAGASAEVVKLLVNSAREYRNAYGHLIAEKFKANKPLQGTAGGTAGLTSSEVLNRTIAIAILHVALEFDDATKVIREMHDFLCNTSAAQTVQLSATDTVPSHVRRIGAAIRRFTEPFPNRSECRNLVNDALKSLPEGPENPLLVFALVGVRFVIIHEKHTSIHSSLFHFPSDDFLQMAFGWADKMKEPKTERVGEALRELMTALYPENRLGNQLSELDLDQMLATTRHGLIRVVEFLPDFIKIVTAEECDPEVYVSLKVAASRADEIVAQWLKKHLLV